MFFRVMAIDDSVIERGKRVSTIRSRLASSRAEFEKKYGISANTLRYWEKPDENHPCGLTEKGARAIVAVARQEGIGCSVDWLMNAPDEEKKDISISPIQINSEFDFYTEIKEKIFSIIGKYNNILSYKISNDLMLPEYNAGDLVIGYSFSRNELSNAIGKICIVETDEEEVTFGKLTKGSLSNRFNILSTNIETNITPRDKINKIILKAAPICLVFKKN